MSKHSQMNDHGDVIIDMESLEKAQKNAKNEQSTKRLKETQSIQTNKDRSRIILIILKITLAFIAFIGYKNYCFNQQSINETQRRLKSNAMTAEEKRRLIEAFEAAECCYTHGEFIAKGMFGSVWKFKKGKEYVAIKFVNKDKYEEKEQEHQRLAYEKIGQYVVKVQKKPAKQFESFMWFEQELMDGDLKSLVSKDGKPKPDALSDDEMMKLMRDLAITLYVFECNGIFHGDVKLGNIMFKREKENYEFRLGDFGFSGKREDDANPDIRPFSYLYYMKEVVEGNWNTPPPKINNSLQQLSLLLLDCS